MKLELYEIRCCRHDEYEKLVDFLREHWSENHIFCKSKKIFEFQHGTARDGKYDFLIAVNKETEEIHAVLGYISSSLYDLTDKENPKAIYGAIWKVRDDIENVEIKKLGLAILYHLIKMFPNSTYITLGLSSYSQTIYNAMHYDFGLMNHYYVANSEKKNPIIISDPIILNQYPARDDFVIKYIDDAQEIDNVYEPNKNPEYVRNRYLRHPMYSYKLLGIYENDCLLCEWVTRKIAVGGNSCIRIVDMIGDLSKVGNISKQLQEYMHNEDCEYVDCYNHGIEDEVFTDVGFIKKSGSTIVPNYFEPFEKRNVDIHYATNGRGNIVIFKADADQDRPNML